MSGDHTPGPWGFAHRKGTDGMFRTEVFCDKGETIATMAWYPKPEGGGVTSTYREANARLIAAAPDLLAIALRFQQHLECGAVEVNADDDISDAVRAALSKATGLPQP